MGKKTPCDKELLTLSVYKGPNAVYLSSRGQMVPWRNTALLGAECGFLSLCCLGSSRSWISLSEQEFVRLSSCIVFTSVPVFMMLMCPSCSVTC